MLTHDVRTFDDGTVQYPSPPRMSMAINRTVIRVTAEDGTKFNNDYFFIFRGFKLVALKIAKVCFIM